MYSYFIIPELSGSSMAAWRTSKHSSDAFMSVSFSAVMFGCVHNTPMCACIDTCTLYLGLLCNVHVQLQFIQCQSYLCFGVWAWTVLSCSNTADVQWSDTTRVDKGTIVDAHVQHNFFVRMCAHVHVLVRNTAARVLLFMHINQKWFFIFQMTQQEINFVAQFLSENFTEVCSQFDVVIKIDCTLVHKTASHMK